MDKFPSNVRIETAGRCNFRCSHCPVGVYGNSGELLSTETFVEIFQRLPAVPKTLVLYAGGEPLLNHELESMISYARNCGVQKIFFNTNASLLTVERAKRLAKSGLDLLYVSFDGDSPEENDRIRIGSNFAKHAPVVRECARFLKIIIYNVKFGNDLKPAKYLTDFFGSAVRYQTDPARTWAHDNHLPIVNHPTRCSLMDENFVILSSGDVVSCCEDLLGDYRFGNVLTEMPIEIWKRMQAVRDAFHRQDYPELCRHCFVLTGVK